MTRCTSVTIQQIKLLFSVYVSDVADTHRTAAACKRKVKDFTQTSKGKVRGQIYYYQKNKTKHFFVLFILYLNCDKIILYFVSP